MRSTSHAFFLLHGREFRNAVVVRGLVVWAGLRLTAFAASAISSQTSAMPALNSVGKLILLTIVALVVGFEANRRGERQFLANLGIPFRTVVSSGLLAPVVIEAVLF
jgi:hypothetical protein